MTAAPGSGVAELVAVMDRLRSPGGCPWDAEQTHASLAQYCLEEAYEVVEAIEDGDRAGLREELGDLLLQVVFHARLAVEDPDDPFDLDDVARGVAAKLVRRHPHVFAAEPGELSGDLSGEQVHARWEQLKRAEKQRTSVLEGIPRAQPALARAQKILSRASRTHLALEPAPAAALAAAPAPAPTTEHSVGAELLALVARAQASGVDAEGALRSAVRDLEARVRDLEAGARAAEADAGGGPARA